LECWREAFTAVLEQYNEYMRVADLYAEEGWLFALFDIDGDGVPELIVWESMNGAFWFGVRSAYTFADGAAQSLVIIEDFGGRPASTFVFAPPDGGEGMVVSAGGEGFWRYMLVRMRDGTLVIDVCLAISVAPRFAEYDYTLYYVRGVKAVSTELPNLPYWIEQDHDRMLMQGYVLVAEEDFDEIRYRVFGTLEEDDIRRHPVGLARYVLLE